MAEEKEKTSLPPKTAKQRYDKLSADRLPYLSRAYECAELTIPALFPREGTTSSTEFYTPFQGVGAEGVNNLAAKQMLALFPPGGVFFRLTMSDFTRKELAAKAGEDAEQAQAEFEEALGQMERAVMTQMEQRGVRMPLFESFQQLAVAGNALLHKLPNGAIKLHRLSNYVVRRDSSGNVLEIVAVECLDRDALPKRALDIVEAHGEYDEEKTDVELYTRVWRDNGKWRVVQEVCDHAIPGTAGTYPLDKLPWLALRFKAVAGEDYGRGFVEERLGDLRSLESLTQSLVEGTAIAAKVLFGVNENGVTSKKAVAESANGAVIDGDLAKDVTTLQVGKQADFATAHSVSQVIQKRLERAFLLLSGVQRDAERVTAEEIRAVVAELETTLGGFYSTFAQELQYPLVACYLSAMAKAGELPHLPKGTVSPQIVTGLDGLGRSSDLAKLDALIDRLVKAIGPEGVAKRLSVDVLVKLYGAALGGDYKGLVKSDAAIQEEDQAAQQAEMGKAAIGPGIKAMSDHALAAQKGAQEGAPAEQ
jgi:hypothetical protein